MTTISNLYASFIKSTGISTDTRRISKGSLFFALRGANFNGNLFAELALKGGAYKVVVDDVQVVKGKDYILVDDSLIALQQLATYHRRQLNIPIIGITGTNGKTTTKELVSAVLSKKYQVSATQGNYNNHIGVPLTLLTMNKGVEIGVVEMGANHPGEIDELCRIAEPDYGIITNVGKAHLEGFGSFEGVMKTKAELYRYIENKSGTLFFNNDNEYLKTMLGEGALLYSYGTAFGNFVSLINQQKSSHLVFTCQSEGEVLSINSMLVGSYNLENVLAAVAIGMHFKIDALNIVKAINAYRPDNNRSQLVVSAKNKVIFDAYNANPTSMMMALSNFVEISALKKVVILGEMKELGTESEKEHAVILSFLRDNSFSKIILVGDSYYPLLKENEIDDWYKNVDDLMDDLKSNSLDNHFILVKGSRSNKLEKLKDYL